MLSVGALGLIAVGLDTVGVVMMVLILLVVLQMAVVLGRRARLIAALVLLLHTVVVFTARRLRVIELAFIAVVGGDLLVVEGAKGCRGRLLPRPVGILALRRLLDIPRDRVVESMLVLLLLLLRWLLVSVGSGGDGALIVHDCRVVAVVWWPAVS